MKTGVSMGGIVITKKAIDKQKNLIKKSNERKKRAKICIECECNNEGYCSRYTDWCGKVNYICLGIKNPYEITSFNKNTKKKKKKNKSKKK